MIGGARAGIVALPSNYTLNDTAAPPSAKGASGRLRPKYVGQAHVLKSDSLCRDLGWAMTDSGSPQTLCASAGVCSQEVHSQRGGSDILDEVGGRCARRCSGNLSPQKAERLL